MSTANTPSTSSPQATGRRESSAFLLVIVVLLVIAAGTILFNRGCYGGTSKDEKTKIKELEEERDSLRKEKERIEKNLEISRREIATLRSTIIDKENIIASFGVPSQFLEEARREREKADIAKAAMEKVRQEMEKPLKPLEDKLDDAIKRRGSDASDEALNRFYELRKEAIKLQADLATFDFNLGMSLQSLSLKERERAKEDHKLKVEKIVQKFMEVINYEKEIAKAILR